MKKTILYLTTVALLVACGSSKPASTETSQPNESGASNEPVSTETTPVDKSTQTRESDFITAGSPQTKPQEIEWLDFETAIDRNEKEKKFIFIDIYTDWCGWCKRMDATTFKDPKVTDFMRNNVYAVKMNAESKEPIAFNGHLYEYKQINAKGGYNTLAINLLDSKMSFPSFVVLSKKETKLGKIIGYKKPSDFLRELRIYVK